MDNHNHFGILLRKFRRERRMSQKELSAKSQLDRTYVSLLERGLRQPSLTTIIKISNAFEMKAGIIVDEIQLGVNQAIG